MVPHMIAKNAVKSDTNPLSEELFETVRLNDASKMKALVDKFVDWNSTYWKELRHPGNDNDNNNNN